MFVKVNVKFSLKTEEKGVTKMLLKTGGQEDCLTHVKESPLWVLVRDFLSSANVLEMRTAGLKWNTARLYLRTLRRVVVFLPGKR